MDGRCFFRSIVIAGSSTLQAAVRKGCDEPLGKLDSVLERSMADRLRNSVIGYMIEHSSFTDVPQEALNGDLPPSKQCIDLSDRLELMANPTECVGEPEIMTTAKLTNKRIIILDEHSTVINEYLPLSGDMMDCVFIRFKKKWESMSATTTCYYLQM